MVQNRGLTTRRVIWVSDVRGWWCELCNREYQEEKTKHFRKVGNAYECPRCYKPMKRITRKHGDLWMSGE